MRSRRLALTVAAALASASLLAAHPLLADDDGRGGRGHARDHDDDHDGCDRGRPRGVRLERVGTYASGLFAQGGAEIAAYDRKSRRLFVVNGNTTSPRIDVLDIRDPAAPALATWIDVTAYGASANSVAVHDGLVAVAVQAAVKTDAGKVVFFDTKGAYLASVTVGALPDMLTFTHDGKRVLVCNEGEPSSDYSIDPAGTVSIIDLPEGGAKKVAKLKQSDVTTIDFSAFVGTPLDPSIRVYGPDRSVVKDLEPEYLALSRDGDTAWVTLQENNALAVLDLRSKTFTKLVGLGFKDHGRVRATLQSFTFGTMPVLGTTPGGTVIRRGGFSGLLFEGTDPVTGKLRFLAHTDRGPNAEPVDVNGDGVNDRPFPLPAFQPEWVRFEADPATRTVAIQSTVGLTRTDGSPLTGISNVLGVPGFANSDEPPVDAFGAPVTLDPLGADLEGIVRAPDGTYWMCDEYRPSILHFDATGRLIARFVPQGSPVGTGTPALPAVYAQRRANRGFEAIAMEGTKVYAFIQSPLDNPDVANDATSKASRICRIVEFDTVTSTTTAEYAYVQEVGSDKIGDAILVGPRQFLVMERDDVVGPTANKKVWRITLNGATNVGPLAAPFPGGATTLERTAVADLLASGSVRPVVKTLEVDLAAVGYDQTDKPEGLAFVDANTIAVVNDNDFGLDGTLNKVAGTVGLKASSPIVLGLIRLERQGLDASDREISSSLGSISIRPWPVMGMYQPDAIAAFRADDGKEYLLCANEGDAREWGTFVEESRVSALPLDPVAFPYGNVLKRNENLGRLTVTNKLGDTDGDGDFDVLHVLGGRSLTVRDADGRVVWDGGDELERLTAERFPSNFNANNDANDFDSRSDNKGPEPEGVTTGKAWGRTYAFLGLERVGGVVVYDLSDPRAPEIVDYANARVFTGSPAAGTAGDLGPEGVLFISESDSPVKDPLVVLTNEVSGTTTIYRLVRTK